MDTVIVNVLSIDAWAGGPDSWTWNSWRRVGSADLSTLPTDDAGLLAWFVSEGYCSEKALKECEIDDDQYNHVIRVKKTGEPLYAIAYGEAQ